MCREALQEEAAVLCLLAKVDSDGLAFDASTSKSSGNNGDQDSSITVVVQEGLEVRLPMAGQLYIGLVNFALLKGSKLDARWIFIVTHVV